MDIVFCAAGGASTIGGSAYFVQVGNTSVLIDFGANPDKTLPDQFEEMKANIMKNNLIPSLSSLSAVFSRMLIPT